jgi:hypothetical protein
MSAGGTLHVGKLDDGYAGAGGRMERGGVQHMGSRRRNGKLSVGAGSRNQKRKEAWKQEGETAGGNELGGAQKRKHSGWTAP